MEYTKSKEKTANTQYIIHMNISTAWCFIAYKLCYWVMIMKY